MNTEISSRYNQDQCLNEMKGVIKTMLGAYEKDLMSLSDELVKKDLIEIKGVSLEQRKKGFKRNFKSFVFRSKVFPGCSVKLQYSNKASIKPINDKTADKGLINDPEFTMETIENNSISYNGETIFKTRLWLSNVLIDYIILEKEFPVSMKKLVEMFRQENVDKLNDSDMAMIFFVFHAQIIWNMNAEEKAKIKGGTGTNQKKKLCPLASKFVKESLGKDERSLDKYILPKGKDVVQAKRELYEHEIFIQDEEILENYSAFAEEEQNLNQIKNDEEFARAEQKRYDEEKLKEVPPRPKVQPEKKEYNPFKPDFNSNENLHQINPETSVSVPIDTNEMSDYFHGRDSVQNSPAQQKKSGFKIIDNETGESRDVDIHDFVRDINRPPTRWNFENKI